MTRVAMAGRMAALAMLLGLGSCAMPPWTLSRSPHDITLRWYSDRTPDAAAYQVAALHCGSWGKSAELATTFKDGSDQIARYRCR
ncbi:MAG: hypothetical protein ACREE2_01655 [Stellaceae bacterium]